MTDKDFQKRQERPALDYHQQRLNIKLSKGKENLQEILWEKRKPPEIVKGYNLPVCRKITPYKKKSSWCCGSVYHLKIDYPVHKENQFNLWVEEMEQRITQIEEVLQEFQKNKAKREKRKKEGRTKKKKRELREEVRALTSVVKLKNWLLQEEELKDQKNLTIADHYYSRIPEEGKNKIKKVYKELFSRDLIVDFIEACS